MPVLSNFRAISAALSLAIVAACAPAKQAPAKPDISYETLINDLGKIEVNTTTFEDLPGDTRAEKLLYQAGIISQMQTAMLVMFDTQEKAIRMSGNLGLANELKDTRGSMMEAANTELEGIVVEAGLLYETFLTPEEIERLIVLHSDPAMQKLIRNQPQIAQGMIPIGEKFGARVGTRYEELVQEKKSEK